MTMKNLKYLYLLFLTTLFISCEDFIDIQPQDKIGVDNYFRTATDIENYVTKYYSTFPGHGNGSVPASEAASDNLILATPNLVLNGTRSPNTGNWTSQWSNIRSINILFDKLENVEDDVSLYSQFLGEAYFFRAWFYANMVSIYGDVPYYTSEIALGDEEQLLKPRDPRTYVVDQILDDLDNAIKHLGLRSSTGNSRLNKETALAFKSRIALYEGSWQKYHAGSDFGTSGADPNKYFQIAVEASEELINGTTYTKGIYSTGNPGNDYYDLFGKDNMSSINEVLFYRIANKDEQLGHNLQFSLIERPDSKAITWSLVSSFLGKDGNPYDYLALAANTKGNAFLSKIAEDCDPRLKSTIWIPGDVLIASTGQTFEKPFLDLGSEGRSQTGFQVKKFTNPNSEGASAGYGNNSETGRIYFRYAEVLLNYAEALYELNGTVATDQLNLIRSRVGMPDFEAIPQVSYGTNLVDYGYTVSDELYAIRKDRRTELAMEGFRVDDYRRWAAHELFKSKRPLGYPFLSEEFPSFTPNLDENGLIDFFQTEMPNGYGFKENRDYLSSIPEDELTLNENLEQNPGW